MRRRLTHILRIEGCLRLVRRRGDPIRELSVPDRSATLFLLDARTHRGGVVAGIEKNLPAVVPR